MPVLYSQDHTERDYVNIPTSRIHAGHLNGYQTNNMVDDRLQLPGRIGA